MMAFCKDKIQLILLFSAVIAILSLSSVDAFAQRKNISGQEMGLLTYYKLTGLDPDFKSWVTSNPVYKDMAKTNKNLARIFMEEEILRLQWGLGTIDPLDTFMNIETVILGKVVSKNDRKFLAIAFPDQKRSGDPYFPYNIAKIWVAVIMKDIKAYTFLELPDKSLKILENYAPDVDRAFPLQLRFTYRGVSAEKKPIKLDGLKQHIMLGEIAHWEVFIPETSANPAQILWEHLEPWYLTEEEDELINMLKGE
jgi:hypothetical protein